MTAITAQVTLHNGTYTIPYLNPETTALEKATVSPCNDTNGYVFQDHDSRLTWEYLDDALAYLFDLYGI